MDFDSFLEGNRLALVNADVALTQREAHGHDQFARKYAERTRMSPAALLGSAK